MEISEQLSIFIGFKLDGSLRHQLTSLTGPDLQYVSTDADAFLRICRKGDGWYVGKVVQPPMSTNSVDDVRRNVLSIVGRLCPDTRLPNHLEIWVCEPEAAPSTEPFVPEGSPPGGGAY